MRSWGLAPVYNSHSRRWIWSWNKSEQVVYVQMCSIVNHTIHPFSVSKLVRADCLGHKKADMYFWHVWSLTRCLSITGYPYYKKCYLTFTCSWNCLIVDNKRGLQFLTIASIGMEDLWWCGQHTLTRHINLFIIFCLLSICTTLNLLSTLDQLSIRPHISR